MTSQLTNLGYWCHDVALRDPGRIAIIDECAGYRRQMSYGELDVRMNQIASWTVASGLQPGDRLLVASTNRLEFIEIVFGAMRAGVVPVPMNIYLDQDRLRHIIQNAKPMAAVLDASCDPRVIHEIQGIEGIPKLLIGTSREGWVEYSQIISSDRDPKSFKPINLPGDHPCYQPYTSGTTGKPKGVVLTHSGQIWWINVRQKYWPYTKDMRSLVCVPLFHKNAMAGSVKPLLYIGGSVVLQKSFQPREFLKALADHRCTMASAVPAVFLQLLGQKDLLDSLNFSALQMLRIGSAPVPAELIANVSEAFGCRVTQSYGLTEGGPVMIGPSVDGRPSPPGSCGVAWPEGEVKLVDSFGKESSGDGELWVRNPGVMKEYFEMPAETAERLQGGWLRTGDIFHKDDDGFYYFLGRVDDMFVCGGENIYPKEVEDILSRHPDVVEACVVSIPDPLKGAVPVAQVVRKEGSELSENDLRTFALQTGPTYMHPRGISFIDKLPVAGTGKVDRTTVRKELMQLFASAVAEKRRQQASDPGD